MNRLRDYVAFAVCFAGFGYMAIWPLSASGSGGALFGGSIICHAPAPFDLLAELCRAPHPLTLSPTLHVLGFLSAVTVVLRLAYRALRARAAGVNTARVTRMPANPMPPPRPKPLPPLPRVKPRGQFGLRSTPR